MKLKYILLFILFAISMHIFSQEEYEVLQNNKGYEIHAVKNSHGDYSCSIEISTEHISFDLNYIIGLKSVLDDAWINNDCEVTFKTDANETFIYSTNVDGPSLSGLMGLFRYEILIPAADLKKYAKELSVFTRGNLTGITLTNISNKKQIKIDGFNVKTKKLFPKILSDIENVLKIPLNKEFKKGIMGIKNTDGTNEGQDWIIKSSREKPNLIADFKHPKSTHITSKTLQWAQDSWLANSNKGYTMYYTKNSGASDKNAVTDIYFVPEDYEPVIRNGKEVTCPPKVQYFTLHSKDNFFGAWTTSVIMSEDGHLYKVEEELALSEVFGDRIYFLLADETMYHPNQSLSCKGHVVESSNLKKTIVTKIK